MTVQHAAAGAAKLEPPASRALHRPIVVATDATEASDPALRAARLVAAQLSGPVHVVSVVRPEPFLIPSPIGVEIPGIPVQELVAARADRVRDEMQRVLGSAREWPVDVRFGIAPLEVADAARESNAQLVVTGLRRHPPIERVLQGETPLGILNSAQVPVLVVSASTERLPRNVVVAVDVGEPSVDAACFARPLLSAAEAVYLVHVQTRLDVAPPLTSPVVDKAYRQAVEHAFDRVTAALELAPSVHVERKVMMGSVAHELLDFAALAKADMIVTGHRRRPFVERVFSGGTAKRLFHGEFAWLLMVPEDARLRERLAMTSDERETNEWLRDPVSWPNFLAEFTRRNTGRRTTLEVHDHLGVQTVVHGYPLLGMDYEREGGRVDIMLGDAAGTARHLRHSVRYVTDIQLHRATDGTDSALRVADRIGQTLLAFNA